MSGRDDAVARMQAHLARRHGRRIRISREEREFIHNNPAQVVHWMNQVDRAVAAYRQTQEAPEPEPLNDHDDEELAA